MTVASTSTLPTTSPTIGQDLVPPQESPSHDQCAKSEVEALTSWSEDVDVKTYRFDGRSRPSSASASRASTPKSYSSTIACKSEQVEYTLPGVGKISAQTTPELSFSDLPPSDDEMLASPDVTWSVADHCPVPPSKNDTEAAAHIYRLITNQDPQHIFKPEAVRDHTSNTHAFLPTERYYGGAQQYAVTQTKLQSQPHRQSVLQLSPPSHPRADYYSDYSDHIPRISLSRSAPCSPRGHAADFMPSLNSRRHNSAQPQLQLDSHYNYNTVSYSMVPSPASSSASLSPYDRSYSYSYTTSGMNHQDPMLPSSSWLDESAMQLPPPTRKPKKQVLACLFCRERKIACGRPEPGSLEPACSQCTRRGHPQSCVYPTESRRGQHKRIRKTEHRVAHD